MSLGLLWPAGLAALAGLLLPLLIHLVRRVETRRTEFAALRWLATQVPPRRRPRFEEWTLLALRLLLVALLALLLARPVLIGGAAQRPWMVVAPGVAAADLPDPAPGGAAELRWLAPGFPPLTDAAPAQTTPLASLLRELDASLPPTAALTVVVPEEIAGLDGERVRLSRTVDWRVVGGSAPEPEAVRDGPPLRIAIRYEPGREPELRYLRAAVAAWEPGDASGNAAALNPSSNASTPNQSFPRTRESSDFDAAREPRHWIPAFAGMTAMMTEASLGAEGEVAVPPEPPADADWLIWLSAGPWSAAVERWIAEGGRVLRIGDGQPAPEAAARRWRSAQTGIELRAWAHGRGQVLALPVALTPAALPELLDPQFPAILRGWLAPVPPPPARALAVTQRLLRGAAVADAPARPLQPWLAGAIALLFLLERWLAADPRRRRSA